MFRIHEPKKQLHKGRLPGTRRADKRDDLAWFDGEVDVLQHRRRSDGIARFAVIVAIQRIGMGDVVEHDLDRFIPVEYDGIRL